MSNKKIAKAMVESCIVWICLGVWFSEYWITPGPLYTTLIWILFIIVIKRL